MLQKIDEEGLMAPLEVIQTLSANAVATMGLVKKYLGDTIEKERKEIANVCHHAVILRVASAYIVTESPAHQKLSRRNGIETKRDRGARQ